MDNNNDEKQTPLHLASYGAEHAIAKILLESGANVDAQDSNGRTPLHEACFIEANLEMVQLLLEHHANVNKQTRTRKTPLHYACVYSEGPDIIEILLENGASVNDRDKDGLTPLHAAADKLDILKVLLQHNAEVDARNNMGATSLHIACELGLLELVQELLKHSQDVNAIANRGGGLTVKVTPIMCAAMGGFSEVVEELLAHGADINSNDSVFGNSLNVATCIDHGEVEMVKTLLKNGCKTNAKAKLFTEHEACTAFESSLYLGHIELMRMFAFHET